MKRLLIALVLLLSSGPLWAADTHITWHPGPVLADNSNAPTGFHVYTSLNFGATWALVPSLNTPYVAGTTTYMATDPSGVVGQCYKATAFNSAGESGASNVGCVASKGGTTALIPNAPTGLQALDP